ncbi:Uncharacterised protein [Mycobacterium tuberculosis]|nr:Uncharacterised protein [Mycobacterium tuberculosis]
MYLSASPLAPSDSESRYRMSGDSTPCMSMFMLPIRSMVESKS